MIRYIVLPNTTDFNVESRVNYLFCFKDSWYNCL